MPVRRTRLHAQSEHSAPQGRFSGRLASKGDEAELVEQCRLLAPLLGGFDNGDAEAGSRNTLSRIVRAIAAGEIREHLLRQQACSQVWCAALSCLLSVALAIDAGSCNSLSRIVRDIAAGNIRGHLLEQQARSRVCCVCLQLLLRRRLAQHAGTHRARNCGQIRKHMLG